MELIWNGFDLHGLATAPAFLPLLPWLRVDIVFPSSAGMSPSISLKIKTVDIVLGSITRACCTENYQLLVVNILKCLTFKLVK